MLCYATVLYHSLTSLANEYIPNNSHYTILGCVDCICAYTHAVNEDQHTTERVHMMSSVDALKRTVHINHTHTLSFCRDVHAIHIVRNTQCSIYHAAMC